MRETVLGRTMVPVRVCAVSLLLAACGGGGGSNSPPNTTIQNRAPTVSVTLTPQSPRTLDDIVASVNVADPDGDSVTLTYAWRRNGTLLSGFTSSTLTNTQHTKGDVIQLTLTATDSSHTVVQTASVTSVDTPPTLVATSPTTVEYGNTFSFSVVASDPDENDTATALRVRYGPAGMTVSNAGVVSWPAVLPMFGPALDVNYAIELVGSAVLSGTVRVTDSDRAEPVRRSELETAAREGSLQIADLDDDGDPELLVAGQTVLYELTWDGTKYGQTWVYPFGINSKSGLAGVVAANVTGTGRKEIFVAAANGILRLDGPGRTLAHELILDENESCDKLEITDIDANGTLDLVCLALGPNHNSNGKVVVVNPVTMQVAWRSVEFSSPNTSNHGLAVGNVDSDPALEIVVGAGYVFDGSTHQAQWIYGTGFGSKVDTGDLDGDGIEEIVGVLVTPNVDSTVQVFTAVLRSPLWDMTVDTGALLVRNIDATPTSEILIGSGKVTAYRYDNGTSMPVQVFEISSQVGVSAIDVGNADGDPGFEVVWLGTSPFEPNSLVVAGLNPTIGVESITTGIDGPFVGGQLAEVAPGQARLVFGTESEVGSGNYGGRRLVALDPASEQLTVSGAINGTLSTAIALDVVDYDHDGVTEIFFGASSSDYYSGNFGSYDFDNDTIDWSSPADLGAALAIAHADYSADGYEDLVAIAGPQYAYTNSGRRIYVFDVRNQLQIWRSLPLTADPVDIAVADVRGDSTPEIIAATSDRVTIYQKSGATFLEVASVLVRTSDVDRIVDILVADTDGDNEVEIYVLSGVSGARISRFDTSLTLQGGYNVGRAHSVHLENLPTARRNLIVCDGDSAYYAPVALYLRALDPMSGTEVWGSPRFGGFVSRNSLYYVDPNGDGKPQISFGAGQSVYLTR